MIGFRIEKIIEQQVVVLRVSGQISAEHIPQLKAEMADGGVVVLDLGEVSLVSGDVIQFLWECESLNIELRNCPQYIREWIRKTGEDLGPNTKQG